LYISFSSITTIKEGYSSSSKSLPLSMIIGVTEPNFEKKTGRRTSILGGGNIEDGHVITLQQNNGFTVDLKVSCE
jgi:hypothetical protein